MAGGGERDSIGAGRDSLRGRSLTGGGNGGERTGARICGIGSLSIDGGRSLRRSGRRSAGGGAGRGSVPERSRFGCVGMDGGGSEGVFAVLVQRLGARYGVPLDAQ